jgi:hypothetical protein
VVPVPLALTAVTVALAVSACAVAVIDSTTEQMTSITEVDAVASFIRLILVSFAGRHLNRAGARCTAKTRRVERPSIR